MKRLLALVVLSFFTITAIDHAGSGTSFNWLDLTTHINIEKPGHELHDDTKQAFVNVASYRVPSHYQSKFFSGFSATDKMNSQRNLAKASLVTLAGNRFLPHTSGHLQLIFPFHHFW